MSFRQYNDFLWSYMRILTLLQTTSLSSSFQYSLITILVKFLFIDFFNDCIMLTLFTFVPSVVYDYMASLIQLLVFPKVNICLNFFQLLLFFLEQLVRFHTCNSSWKCLLILLNELSVLYFPLRHPSHGHSSESPPSSCSHLKCGSLSPLLLEISSASLLCGSPWFLDHLTHSFLVYILSFCKYIPSNFSRKDKFLRTLMSESIFIFYPHTCFGAVVVLVKWSQ